MTVKEMQKDINKTAKAARKAFAEQAPEGSKIIDINYGIPYVDVCSGKDNYFFQGEEASNLLEEATEIGNKFNVSVEDAIIWKAQSW